MMGLFLISAFTPHKVLLPQEKFCSHAAVPASALRRQVLPPSCGISCSSFAPVMEEFCSPPYFSRSNCLSSSDNNISRYGKPRSAYEHCPADLNHLFHSALAGQKISPKITATLSSLQQKNHFFLLVSLLTVSDL